MPILFLIYINPVLTEIELKYPNSQIQAFVNGIIIILQKEAEINQILNHTHKLIDKLKLKMNLNKCEIIAPFNNKSIIDEITHHPIQITTDMK